MTEACCPKDATCERILDEAEALFAEKGYDAVSIREITRAAGANLAAVSYHFGGKKSLYLEVFRLRWVPRAHRFWRQVEELEERENLTPEMLVRSLTGVFLEQPVSEEEHRMHVQLMLRERLQPTEAMEIMQESFFRPMLDRISRLLEGALPGKRNREELVWDAQAIMGMAIHLHKSRELRFRTSGSHPRGSRDARLMEHMVRFCLRGLALGEDPA